MDSCFEFFFTNLPFCLKLGIEGVTGCGKRANFMGWQATPAFLWRFPRVARGNFRSSYAASIFLEYSVLVICACISVAGAKKKERQPAWGTIEGSDEIGETPGGRLRSTDRLIIPVCIYLRTWSLVSLFSTSLLPLWIDLFEISSFLEFLDYVFFFLLFLPSFSRVLRIAIAGFFSEKGELFLRWIHRSGIRERVPWQRENSNDRTAWERF